MPLKQATLPFISASKTKKQQTTNNDYPSANIIKIQVENDADLVEQYGEVIFETKLTKELTKDKIRAYIELKKYASNRVLSDYKLCKLRK